MKSTSIKILMAVFTVSLTAFSQKGKVKKANDNFDNYAFVDAIASYENLVEDGYTDEQIFKKLGNANYLNAKYGTAAAWFEKLFALENSEVAPDYIYRYAQSLKSLGKYEESDEWMKKFNTLKSDDQRAERFVGKKNYLDEIKTNSGRYTIKNLDLNSEVSDFSPSFYKDKLVFSTARDTGITSRNIHQWNKGAFLNLYMANQNEDGNFSGINRFSKKINTKTHESSAVFTQDGNTIYFTRNNSKNGKFSRDSEGISRLKIYKAVFKDEEWGSIEELPFNADDYSVAHPALSADESILYFSSDMPGSLGASDIFMVTINPDGTYGTPKNVGGPINTEGRETFPFVSSGDIIYFASDGHPGLGGLDIFAAKLDGSNNQIINLGEPVNGKEDDFSFIINTNNNGYFASNRENGKGDDDIYSFVETEALKFRCSSMISGIVVDIVSKKPLSNVAISIVNENDVIVFDVKTDNAGSFETELDCTKKRYKIIANKEDYKFSNTVISLENSGEERIKIELLKAEVMDLASTGTNLISFLKLNPIHFDLNEYRVRSNAQVILKSVFDYLEKYQGIRIEIRSHTDAKASNQYNQVLSNKRAKATRDYLVDLGVDTDRMVFKGYGEEQLINDCLNWNLCSPEENEKNRRSEIIVID